jgi:aromatic-L-amino-acid decarboxylase
MIGRTCGLARYLESRIAETPELELLAPVELNIVCFRYRGEDSDRLNEQIVVALQDSGIAAPSTTRIGGRLAIRAAIVNHRTSCAEIDALVEHTLCQGRALEARVMERAAAGATELSSPNAPGDSHAYCRISHTMAGEPGGSTTVAAG